VRLFAWARLAVVGMWMIPEAARRPAALRAGGALAATLALMVLVALSGPRLAAGLSYDRAALAAGEWWRALTAHLVHLDARHLALNAAGLVLLVLVFAPTLRLRDWFLAGTVAALSVSFGLYFASPEVSGYVGLSGVLHGWWAAGAVSLLAVSRLEGTVALAALALKLLVERRFGPLGGALTGMTVITAAHRYGALGGLAFALGLRLYRKPL
jgi:rhomboid family GlyGly-CTERM serine protease